MSATFIPILPFYLDITDETHPPFSRLRFANGTMGAFVAHLHRRPKFGEKGFGRPRGTTTTPQPFSGYVAPAGPDTFEVAGQVTIKVQGNRQAQVKQLEEFDRIAIQRNGPISLYLNQGSAIANMPKAPRRLAAYGRQQHDIPSSFAVQGLDRWQSAAARQDAIRTGDDLDEGSRPWTAEFDGCTCGGLSGSGFRSCAGHNTEVVMRYGEITHLRTLPQEPTPVLPPVVEHLHALGLAHVSKNTANLPIDSVDCRRWRSV